MNKKTIIVLISIAVIIIVGLVACQIYARSVAYQPPKLIGAAYLNKAVDFKAVLYGEDIAFPDDFKYTKVDDLSDDSIFLDADYVYLLISDFDGKTDFSREDFLRLIEYADKHPNFNFYYLGTDKLDMIKNNLEDCNLCDEDMSFGYMIYEGLRVRHYGMWLRDDEEKMNRKEVLGEEVCMQIYRNVKSNE